MGSGKTSRLSTLANLSNTLKIGLRDKLFTRDLILSSLFYSMAGVTPTWDQGSSATIATLPGFQHQFGITSAAGSTRNFTSFVYIGATFGALICFIINDRIGRLWAMRVYMTIWIIGQLTATFTPNVPGLYAARIISGTAFGALTVTGPLALVEISPANIRGLLTTVYVIVTAVALFTANFCVLGVYKHIAPSRLQYQIVFSAPCAWLLIWILGSFFLCESPRWLLLVNRYDDALQTLAKLRALPIDHPSLLSELREMQKSIRQETERPDGTAGSITILEILNETFTQSANLRRVQQTLILWAIANLSGANSITSYLVHILDIIGGQGTKAHEITISGLYGVSKFGSTIIASLFFVDAIGRRRSLFVGTSIQLATHIYIAVYINRQQSVHVSKAAGDGALAAIFFHSFGYCVGLLILPVVLGSEIWPSRIRSFGTSLGQTMHYGFHYAMTFATPSLLKNLDNWGAFVFFAGWCAFAIVYIYLLVPEVAGLSIEQMDEVFKGPWLNAHKRSRRIAMDSGTHVGEGYPDDENPKQRVLMKDHV